MTNFNSKFTILSLIVIALVSQNAICAEQMSFGDYEQAMVAKQNEIL